MTRPLYLPVDHVRRHIQAHHDHYQDAMVVLATLLFLVVGAVVAVTKILPTLH